MRTGTHGLVEGGSGGADEPLSAADRAAAVAVLTLGAAFLSGLAALTGLTLGLPPTDLAHGQSVLESLADPFVRAVFFPVVLAGAAVAFPFALWLLWPVRLVRAAPFVAGISAVAAGLAAFAAGPLGIPAGLLAGVAAMIHARREPTWRRASS